MSSAIRSILKEAKHLPSPVRTKLKHNIRQVNLSQDLSIEEKRTAQQALLRLITWLSKKARDDAVLFKHFK